ncbi:MAG: tRNA dihydrouridine synthase DusB [Acutalibacteraceae bacterium]
MKIGKVEINGYAALAPMAGVTDRAFRELCKSYGASYVVGEMVSAKGVSYKNVKSTELMELSLEERPAAVQLFGNEPDVMAKAAVSAMQFKPDILDINMGCPAPKITGNNCGSALMRDPKLCAQLVKAVKKAVEVPVTVKIRKGWDDENVNALEVAKYCEDSGADAITIHGRTRQQFYSGEADLDIIRKIKENVSVPVIGNGDITNAQQAVNMYEYTNCDLVMVGRGALGNPWVFSQINAWITDMRIVPPPTVEEKLVVMLRHIEKICKYKGEQHGIKEARKHIAWYLKGFKNAAGFRDAAGRVSGIDDVKALIVEVHKANRG